jgi:hypothetical protein
MAWRLTKYRAVTMTVVSTASGPSQLLNLSKGACGSAIIGDILILNYPDLKMISIKTKFRFSLILLDFYGKL